VSDRLIAGVDVGNGRLSVSVKESDGSRTVFTIPFGATTDFGSYQHAETFALALHDLASALRLLDPGMFEVEKGSFMVQPGHSPLAIRR